MMEHLVPSFHAQPIPIGGSSKGVFQQPDPN
jgi:hypothetical protein